MSAPRLPMRRAGFPPARARKLMENHEKPLDLSKIDAEFAKMMAAEQFRIDSTKIRFESVQVMLDNAVLTIGVGELSDLSHDVEDILKLVTGQCKRSEPDGRTNITRALRLLLLASQRMSNGAVASINRVALPSPEAPDDPIAL